MSALELALLLWRGGIVHFDLGDQWARARFRERERETWWSLAIDAWESGWADNGRTRSHGRTWMGKAKRGLLKFAAKVFIDIGRTDA